MTGIILWQEKCVQGSLLTQHPEDGRVARRQALCELRESSQNLDWDLNKINFKWNVTWFMEMKRFHPWNSMPSSTRRTRTSKLEGTSEARQVGQLWGSFWACWICFSEWIIMDTQEVQVTKICIKTTHFIITFGSESRMRHQKSVECRSTRKGIKRIFYFCPLHSDK